MKIYRKLLFSGIHDHPLNPYRASHSVFHGPQGKGSVSCLPSQGEKTDPLQKVSVFSPVLVLWLPAGWCFVLL